MVKDTEHLALAIGAAAAERKRMRPSQSKTTLELATAFTLKAEGKFTIDDGGPTMMGVTQKVYDAYRTIHSLPRKSVAEISNPEVMEIMRTGYWEPARCDVLPTRLAICQFDWAYNHGVGGAIATLQGCLGVEADGVFGALTLAAVKAAGVDLVTRFLDARRAWYRKAAVENPAKYGQYLDDWLKRVDQLEMYLNEVD